MWAPSRMESFFSFLPLSSAPALHVQPTRSSRSAMIRVSTNNRWLCLAFLLGIALGGFAGWQVARRGAIVSEPSNEPGNPGTASHRSGDGGSLLRAPSVKFTPSGDPNSDFRQILRMRDATSRASAFQQLLSSMSPDEIAKLMKTLKRFGDDQEQEDQTGGMIAFMASQQIVVDHAAQSDPAAVLSALSAAGKDMQNGEFYKDVLRGWAARDPEAARLFFEQNTLQNKTADAKGIAGALVRELVKTDPEGAFRWLRGLRADFTNDVAHDALQTLSHYDGVKAGQLLAQNNDLKKAPEFVAAMTAGWARTEPDKALEWTLKLPPNIAAEGIKTAAGAWAQKDFPAALTAISALQGEQRAAALNGLSSSVGEKHLDELLPLVESLPESADRAAAVGSLVGSLVDKSPEEAEAWLTGQPVGNSRDQGTIVLALKTMDSDPESALEWASTVNADTAREQWVNGLVDTWLKNDPKAARAWVQQSAGLTEADRARLLVKTGR